MVAVPDANLMLPRTSLISNKTPAITAKGGKMSIRIPGDVHSVAVGVTRPVRCAAPPALAVPSFARQTGMACEACHTVFLELNHFGRMFKANAYTLDNLKPVRGIECDQERAAGAERPAAHLADGAGVADQPLQGPA